MSRDESYSKQVLTHHFARVACHGLTPWVLALAAMGGGGTLAYELNGGEPDRIGAENRDTFFAEMRTKEVTLLPKVDAYAKDLRQRNAGKTAERGKWIKSPAPAELQQEFQDFVATLYTDGHDGEPTLSEKDIQVLLSGLGRYSANTVGSLGGQEMINVIRSQRDIEHFDSCFADYAPVSDDMRSRSYAAQEIASCVGGRDTLGGWEFFLGLVVSVYFGFSVGFAAENARGKGSKLRTLAKNKPQRPQGH